MNYSINWLQTQIENGIQPEYLFFWGHAQKTAGVTDKSCFSQWYPSHFTVNRIAYATAEHWMMAQKAFLFKDGETLQKIYATQKPAHAKGLGREVKNFDAAIWEVKAYEFVVEGNCHKFSQNKNLKKFLLYTGDTIIVEAAPNDFIWGIGLSQDDKDAANPFKWKGTNLLGFALMEVRDKLKNS
jgi:ribA/ribD-fused uncharacterized protein